jgi:hypothetical protein
MVAESPVIVDPLAGVDPVQVRTGSIPAELKLLVAEYISQKVLVRIPEKMKLYAGMACSPVVL